MITVTVKTTSFFLYSILEFLSLFKLLVTVLMQMAGTTMAAAPFFLSLTIGFF